jgi:integrase
MLATLTFAGLRIGELLRLRWRDVNLAGGWLTVRDSKTDAGRRKVKIASTPHVDGIPGSKSSLPRPSRGG